MSSSAPGTPNCGSDAPYTQAPAYAAPQCQAPACQGAAAGCGCHDAGSVYGGQVYGGQVYAGSACGTCGVANMGGCGCGNIVNGYGGVVSDPYLSGEVVGGTMPYDGQIISDTVVGGPTTGAPVVGGQSYPGPTAPIQSDNFNARKFDSDGKRILWEQPLPQGTTAL